MTNLTYGNNISVDSDKLPSVSVDALLRRGFSHLLGNEQASKVASHFEGKTPTDEEKAAYKAACQEWAVKALTEGTIGTRTGAPRGTQKETVVRELAKKEVSSVLKANKVTFPTGDKKVKLPDGRELSGAELIAAYLVKHGERLGKEADAEMKARERAAAKAGDLGAAFA